jgi:hypothetical protein
MIYINMGNQLEDLSLNWSNGLFNYPDNYK